MLIVFLLNLNREFSDRIAILFLKKSCGFSHCQSSISYELLGKFPFFHATSMTVEVSTIRQFFTAKKNPGKRCSCRSTKEDLLLERDLHVCTTAPSTLCKNTPNTAKGLICVWLYHQKREDVYNKELHYSYLQYQSFSQGSQIYVK